VNTSYNCIAGRNLERLAALSDGIFAVAMTLLVLDLRVPAAELVQSEHDLWRALGALAPRLVMYMMSFLTLGIFWVGQQTQLNHLARSDRHLTWIHLAFLLAVTVTPFSTTLLAEHSRYRVALLTYWGNIVFLGSVLYGSWGYAIRKGLVKDDLPADVPAAIAAGSWSRNRFMRSAPCFVRSTPTGASRSSCLCSSITRLERSGHSATHLSRSPGRCRTI